MKDVNLPRREYLGIEYEKFDTNTLEYVISMIREPNITIEVLNGICFE